MGGLLDRGRHHTPPRYLGCLETVQEVAAIQRLTGQKRLLDAAA